MGDKYGWPVCPLPPHTRDGFPFAGLFGVALQLSSVNRPFFTGKPN